MKILFAGLLLAAAFAASGCAPLGMSADLQVRSAPPPPSFQFNGEPHFNRLGDRDVSVLSDDSFGYDMFSSGGSYYLYTGGYWYRAQDPRGPFAVVESRRVPKPIFGVNDSEHRWRTRPQGLRGQQQNGDQGNGRGSANDRGGH
jgi:hypothetical protein